MKSFAFFREKQSLKKWLFTIFIALLPALITLGILSFIFNVDITNFRPRIWHDQGSYWHWARSFSEYSFDVGYNGFDETIAPASFNHYAENGPFYQVIYGTTGKFLGWTNALPIYINMGLVSVALLIFMRATKLETKQIGHIGLLMTFLFPILLYLPTSMHESLNQAIAIVIASIFYLLLKEKEKISTFQKIIFILFLVIASLIRLSWAILLLPFFFMLLKGKTLKKLSISILLSAVLGYAVLKISSSLLPPTGNIIFELIYDSLTLGPSVLLNHIREQLSFLLSREKNRMDLVVTLQALILAIANLFYLARMLKKRVSSTTFFQSSSFFNFYNLLTPLGMGIVFYLVNGFHRIFIPHIIISALLLIASKKYIPIYALLFFNIIASQPFISKYKATPANFLPDSKEFVDSRALLEKYVFFDTETDNSWCNTLLIPVHEYNKYVTMMPVGIGISPIISPDNLEYPLKSKYLLLDQESLARGAYIKYFPMESLDLELLDSLPHTNIYYNPASGCPLE